MNFRGNKGYTGIDISISIIILTIVIPIVSGMVYNLGKSRSNMEQKSYAINIASNILEQAKSINNLENIYSKEEDQVEENPDNIFITNLENNLEPTEPINQPGSTIEFSLQDQKQRRYKVKIDIVDFADNSDSEEIFEKNYVKTVNVKIMYSLGKNIETIEMSTVISKK